MTQSESKYSSPGFYYNAYIAVSVLNKITYKIWRRWWFNKVSINGLKMITNMIFMYTNKMVDNSQI